MRHAGAPGCGSASGAAQGPVRRLRVRAVRQDGRSGRRGRRAAQGAPPPRDRRPGRDAALRAASRGTSSSVLDGRSPCRCGAGTARRACAWAASPGSDVPVYFLEHHRYFDRPYLYGPPDRGLPRQPRALHLPVARRARAVQGARLVPRHRPRQRLADRARARLRQHGRVGAAPARRGQPSTRSTTSPTRACSTAAPCSSPGSGASTTTRASSSTSAR